VDVGVVAVAGEVVVELVEVIPRKLVQYVGLMTAKTSSIEATVQ
jgi:hypothetical protein